MLFTSGLGDCEVAQALCKKLISVRHSPDHLIVGLQCRLRGSSGAGFIFRCQDNLHTHAHTHRRRDHTS